MHKDTNFADLKSDLALIRQAAKKNWAVPEHIRGVIMSQLCDAIQSDTLTRDEQLNIVKTIIALEANDIKNHKNLIDSYKVETADTNVNISLGSDLEAAAKAILAKLSTKTKE
jgi:hypothetical protein